MQRGGRRKFQPPRGAGGGLFGSSPGGVEESIPIALLKKAQQSGQLNLSGRGIESVPDRVWRLDIDPLEDDRVVSLDKQDDGWWERVALVKLMMASNQLKELSDDIKLLPALNVLDVHDNQLVSLPGSIGELGELVRFFASHNCLSSVPPEVSCLQNLKYLGLEHNQIVALPSEFHLLRALEVLNVSNNKLKNLPDGIGQLSLVTLDISNNSIEVLPSSMGGMTRLKELDASYNRLSNVPSFDGCSSLQRLNLRHNRLASLPLVGASLMELCLGDNVIRELSAAWLSADRSELGTIDLRDNKIEVIPDIITGLSNLERLDLTNNDIHSLPFALGTMSKMKSLLLDGNPLRSIRRDILQRGTVVLLKYLRDRMPEPTSGSSGSSGGSGSTLSDMQSSMSQAASQSHEMALNKKLDYSKKKVTEVADDVWAAASAAAVSTVDFSHNMLTGVPPRLVDIAQSLTTLILSHNRLSGELSGLGGLTRLTMLDVRNNQLSSIGNIQSLSCLREVVISFNRLAQLPTALYELATLEVIIASDNQISVIDVDGLSRLLSLSTLDLQNNDIAQVPPVLGNLRQLRSLQLSGNAFRIPRPAILAKGTSAILEYLRGRIPA